MQSQECLIFNYCFQSGLMSQVWLLIKFLSPYITHVEWKVKMCLYGVNFNALLILFKKDNA